MALAWHIAALVRWPHPQKGHRVKAFPKLETLLAGAAPRRQSWQEQMAVMSLWAAHMQRVEAQRKSWKG